VVFLYVAWCHTRLLALTYMPIQFLIAFLGDLMYLVPVLVPVCLLRFYKQEMMYNYKAELTGILSRSYI